MSEDTPETEADAAPGSEANRGGAAATDSDSDSDSNSDSASVPEAEAEAEARNPETEVASDLTERVAAHDESLAAEVEALREERDALEADLRETESEVEDLTERLQRAQADFQNYKKRTEREQERIRERATEDLVERLVEVRDNLARALEEAETGTGGDGDEDAAGIREGVETTLAEFDRVLAEENVEIIEPDPGEEVDPTRHQVMLRVDSDRPAGAIDEVYRPGYEMADRVLREAQVTVSDDE
jgi:molecular chaperone GrpE